MNYAISALVCHDINLFLAEVGLEISGKLVFAVFRDDPRSLLDL